MRKILSLLLVTAMLATNAGASNTFTTNYNLTKPSDGSTSWGADLRGDLDSIDSQMFINAGSISGHISNATGAHAATAISAASGTHCNTQTNVQTYLDCLDAVAVSGGTVTSTSVVSANGFAGTVATSTTTPAITLTTTVSGLIKGVANALVAAVSGTDYSPGTSGNATGIVKSTTGTGALTTAVAGDFPILNQSTTGNADTATISTNLSGGLGGSIPYQTAVNATSMLPNGTLGQVLTSNGGTSAPSWTTITGTGTVTSVAVSVPAFLSVAGSPITTSGTIAISLSGTALPIANGGTAATTPNAAFNNLSPMTTGGDLIYGGASGAATRLANGSSGQVLTSNGGTAAPSWTTISGVGNLNAKFHLDGAIIPFIDIDGPHYQVNTQSLTVVNITALNSGTSGSTQIRVNQYRSGSLFNSATATLSASSGNPNGSAAALSGTLSLVAGDIVTVDVVSVAGGTPESLTVEY